MRILLMTDSPFIPSGQAKVGREIAIGLARRGHEVGYIGWFHRQDIFPNLPHNIQFWQTNNSQYGADVLDSVCQQFQPDVLLTIGDFWNLWWIADPNICRMRRYFQWCSYIPVDGEPMNGGLPPGIIRTVEDIDIPVAYTEYAKAAVLKSVTDQETRGRIRTIYHGVDTNVYKPLSVVERHKLREQFGIRDKFLFLTVCRNQSRKNIPRLFQAWKKFSEMPEFKDRVLFWPHMNFNDPMGWRIDDIITEQKMENRSLMYYDQVAHGQSEMHLIPETELAKLYQIADAFVLISGEGFGLPTFEAMATRVPCILINHSASGELGAEGRAHLIENIHSHTWTGGHLTERPAPDMDATVDAFAKIFRDREYRESIAQKGYDFATKYTWDKVTEEWNTLFLEREIPFIKPMKMEVVV
jgi:glycosyltransferase involved in cell wall biosynthesis